MKPLKGLSLIALVMALALPAVAQIRYVSDVMLINFRTGPGNQYKITKRLTSGTKLQFVSQNENKSWTEVRTGAGDTGWVLTQYLVSKPTSRILVDQQQDEIEQLQAKVDELQGRLDALNSEQGDQADTISSLQSERDVLAKELNELKRTAANAINLDKKNLELVELNTNLENRVQLLEAHNQSLKDDQFVTYSLIGASIFLVGMIAPLLIGLRRRPQRSTWH